MSTLSSTDAAAPRPKPKLRGVSHLVGAVLAIPAAVVLYQSQTGHTMATMTYGVSLFLLLAVSAFYHVPHWEPEPRARLRRVDRSMIYIFVAGTYTPILSGLGENVSSWVLYLVWSATSLGVGLTIFLTRLPRVLVTGLYVILGWGAVMIMPAVLEHFGWSALWKLAIGGVFYTVGAVAYAFRRPDPVPAVFGYHEIFHLCVLIAALLHYLGVWQILIA